MTLLETPSRGMIRHFLRPRHIPALITGMAVLFVSASASAASSFQEDANGFVVMEAEDFDVNATQDNGAWLFDNTYLGFDFNSGWGYMKAFSAGGIDTNLNPHLDFKVSFANTGPHYIWVSGSDAGGNTVHLGLDGVAPITARVIGGPDGVFGARGGGEWDWVGTNNTGSGYGPKAYLTVPTTGEHTVNLFIAASGLYVDRIVLTTNIDFAPDPIAGGTNSGLNLPPETLAPSPGLTVAVTQPASGKSFANGPSTVVTVAAKPTTNGPSVSIVEFFAKQLPSGGNTKIGQATTLPYLIGWSNPAVGNYALTAKVTDVSSQTATSAVVNVSIIVAGYQAPLQWETNNFDTGLGTFTLASQNHTSGFDFDWRNSANAGGPPGELGGIVVRAATTAPYVTEPLDRRVSLNEDLWFTGTMMFSNVSAASDIFIGYLDTASTSNPRMGLKIREPSGTDFRFAVEPNSGLNKITSAANLPPLTVASFELHWVPTGNGDGSGTLTGVVNNVSFSFDYSGAPNAATYNAFGWLAPSQGNDDLTKYYSAYFDNLQYVAPSHRLLHIQPLPSGKALLSWAISGFTLQYNTNALTSTNWVDSVDPVGQQGYTYYVTNSIVSTNRWYRLRHPL